jgi:hypothetical protein
MSQSLSEIVHYLMEYPVKEPPYPKGYPEDLQFEPYPGTDFVIGACDEQIDTIMKMLMGEKSQPKRELYQSALDMWQALRHYRVKKISHSTEFHYKRDLYSDAVEAFK